MQPSDAASAQEPCPCGTPHECIPGSPGCVIEAEAASAAYVARLEAALREIAEHPITRVVDSPAGPVEERISIVAARLIARKALNA